MQQIFGYCQRWSNDQRNNNRCRKPGIGYDRRGQQQAGSH